MTTLPDDDSCGYRESFTATPPPGWRWHPRAMFFSPLPARLRTQWTECVACGCIRRDHGPELQCPERIEEVGP